MRKKTITILFIVSTVLGFGDIIGIVITILLELANCASNCGTMDPAKLASGSLIDLLGVSLGVLVAAAGSILYLVAWIGSLVKQGKQQQWGWFTANLIAWFLGFGWIYMVVYLIAVPERDLAGPAIALPAQPYLAYSPNLQYQAQQPYPGNPQYQPQQPYAPPPRYSSGPYSSYPQNRRHK